MKLYATITSERASKGQGGNEYLIVQLQSEDKDIVGTLTMKPHGLNSYQILWTSGLHEAVLIKDGILTKGKKQTGECIRCNGNGCPACDGTKGSKYNPEPY